MMSATRQDVVWQDSALANTFLNNVRGAIPYAQDQIEIMLRLLRARVESIQSFADLGCGGGILAQALLAEYPNARGVLIDFSEPMLDAARQNLAEYSSQLRFVHADLASGEWAGLAGASFDAVVSSFAIHHLTHERKCALYGEIYEILNPSGIFINIEHVKSSTVWVEQLADNALIDSLYAFHHKRDVNMTRERVAEDFVHRPDKVANILAPIETQCEWLREIGFQDVDIYFKVFELAVFGGRRM